MFHTSRKITDWLYTLFNHRKIIKELEEEAAKDFELKIKEFRQTVESTEVSIDSPFLSVFVDHLIRIFDEMGGDNYLSMSCVRGGRKYVFTIRPKEGKTPAQLAGELARENEELKAKIKKLQQ